MIYAKDKQTELALEDDWHHNVYGRRYVALVSGEMEEDEGTVVTPEENMGDVIGDLNKRRGLVQGMEEPAYSGGLHGPEDFA